MRELEEILQNYEQVSSYADDDSARGHVASPEPQHQFGSDSGGVDILRLDVAVEEQPHGEEEHDDVVVDEQRDAMLTEVHEKRFDYMGCSCGRCGRCCRQ